MNREGTTEPLLDAKAVAQILGLHPQTVLKRVRAGVLPAIRYARCWRFRRADIARWIDAHAATLLQDSAASAEQGKRPAEQP